MGTTAQKLQYLVDAKADIKAAIENAGITVGDTELGEYGALIERIARQTPNTYADLHDLIQSGNSRDTIDFGDELNVNVIYNATCVCSDNTHTATIADPYIFAKAVGECENKTYKIVYNGTDWTYGSPISLSDFGIVFTGTPASGETISITTACVSVPYVFTAYNLTGTNATRPSDGSIDNFWIVEEKYCHNEYNSSGTGTAVNWQFDQEESAICVTPGYTLSAGQYYIYNVAGATSDYWCNYKRLYYTFTIPTDITATGATGDIQLRFTGRGSRETEGDARGVYQLYTKPYKCIDDTLYYDQTITFEGQVAQPDSTFTDIRTIANFTTDQSMTSVGIIYNNLGHVCYGNNEFNVSNLKQRMNSSDLHMTPVRLHKNDVVTSLKNAKGVMYGLDPRFIAIMQIAKYYQEHALSDEFTRYAIYSDESVAFSLSMKEWSFNIQTDEGIVTQLYSSYTDGVLDNNANTSRIKYINGTSTAGQYVWSRSAYSSYSNYSRYLYTAGSSNSSSAYGSYRVLPAYIIS